MGCELTGGKNRLRFLGRRDSGTDSGLGDCTVKAGCSLCLIPVPQAAVSSQRGLRRARGWWRRWKEPHGSGADKAGGSGLSLSAGLASGNPQETPGLPGEGCRPTFKLSLPFHFLPKLERKLAVESDRSGLKPVSAPTSCDSWWSYNPSEPQFPCLKPAGSRGRADSKFVDINSSPNF